MERTCCNQKYLRECAYQACGEPIKTANIFRDMPTYSHGKEQPYHKVRRYESKNLCQKTSRWFVDFFGICRRWIQITEKSKVTPAISQRRCLERLCNLQRETLWQVDDENSLLGKAQGRLKQPKKAIFFFETKFNLTYITDVFEWHCSNKLWVVRCCSKHAKLTFQNVHFNIIPYFQKRGKLGPWWGPFLLKKCLK